MKLGKLKKKLEAYPDNYDVFVMYYEEDGWTHLDDVDECHNGIILIPSENLNH